MTENLLADLFAIQLRVVHGVKTNFHRYLYGYINWENRLIGIIGGRGTGKTTLLLQYYCETYNDPKKCLYISADNPLVMQDGIYTTVCEYFKYYGECVIIDEIHKQNNWSIDVKALYDAYPDKKFIISGSSIINILNERGDLSRRLMLYKLEPLSFREYLNFRYKKSHESFPFETIVKDHSEISGKILYQHPRVIKDFHNYLEAGNFPFFIDHKREEYFSLLLNVIDKIIYEDIPSTKSLLPSTSIKLKKLIGYLTLSKIPLVNITSLTSEIEVSKDTLYMLFDLLNRAEILNIVRIGGTNLKVMKHSKILFTSPNIYYALSENWWIHDPDPGNIRESFFASQVGSVLDIHTSVKVDFTVAFERKVYEVEIDGRNKSGKQLKGIDSGLLFKDNIEIGTGNTIPLYLSGFLY
ncbi:MAG: AAA family ATPase [Spirochaetia bacterium]